MEKYIKFVFNFFIIYSSYYNVSASEALTKEQVDIIEHERQDLYRETKRIFMQSNYDKAYTTQNLNDNLLLMGKKLKSTHHIPEAEEKVLFQIICHNMPTSIVWKLIAQVYTSTFPNILKMIQLFETRSDISPQQIVSILNTHIQSFGKSDFLTYYILGIITRGELYPKGICKALSLLDPNRLFQEDWLTIIDNVFAEHPTKTETKKTFLSKKDIREVRCRMDGAIQLSPMVSHTLSLYKAGKNALFSQNRFTKKFRTFLLKTPRPLDTDLAIVEHLSQRFPKETSIQKGLMYYWMKYLDIINTPLSMGDLKRIMTQAHNIKNKTMITRLFHHANHRVKELPPPLRQKLIVVASQDACGDGLNPETYEYFNGKQYPWFSYLAPIFQKLGYDVEMKCWENENINWEQYPCLMVGPIWGYWEWGKQEKLEKWLEQMKTKRIPLINHHDIIKWIYEKTYLIRLQEAGIPVIPSLFVSQNDRRAFNEIQTQACRTFGTSDIIMKPNIGAAANLYLHLKKGQEEEARQHLEVLTKNNKGAIIQPFCREVYDYGEISCFFGGKSLSHFYIKLCAPESEFVQVFHGGQSHHGNKDDLSYNSQAFFKKLRAFRPDLKLTPEMLAGAMGKIHLLFFFLKKHFERENIPEPTFIRLDCILIDGIPHIMEVEGSNCYPEVVQAQNHSPSHKIALKYVEELIRQQTIYRTKAKYGLENCSQETTRNYKLGNNYYEGNGVEQDFKRAFNYWKKAADQGHKEARVKLGTLYYKGEGVERDYRQARLYLSDLNSSEKGTVDLVDAEIERVKNLKEWSEVKNAYASKGDPYYRENLRMPPYENIMFIPEEIGEFSELREVRFDSNLLSCVPISFQNLKWVEELKFSSNCFKYIPQEIFNFTNLKHIDFSYNCLTVFPERLLKLWELEMINLTGNKITSIPKEIYRLSKLLVLDIGQNAISTIPYELMYSQKLRYLSLKNNPIRSLDLKFFELLILKKDKFILNLSEDQEGLINKAPLTEDMIRELDKKINNFTIDIEFLQ